MEYRLYFAVFFKTFTLLALFGALVLLPYGWWFTAKSGDVDMRGVVAEQAAGRFALFGSGLSRNSTEYKLALYEAVKPEIIALGSSRVTQFRGRYFTKRFLNMGADVDSLPALRGIVDAVLKIHTPEAVILGLDFWWFTRAREPHPFQEEAPASGGYAYSLEVLKKPYLWLLTGKISPGDFFAPLTGGFEKRLYGIAAQKFRDGFAPDGSMYSTADVTGMRKPSDYQFRNTLKRVEYGTPRFEPAPELSGEHADALAEILCKLRSRGVRVYLFLPPLAQPVYDALYDREDEYPRLFDLSRALAERDVEVRDYSNPQSLRATDCEFIDGLHGGDVVYARILRDLADKYPSLVQHMDIMKLDEDIHFYAGFAMVPDPRVTDLPEIDFMRFSCPKERAAPPELSRPAPSPAPKAPARVPAKKRTR
jgi:hypothetical protein